MDAVRGRAEVTALPLKLVYLFYCLLFGFVLYDVGFGGPVWAGVPVLMFILGRGLRRIGEEDLPLAMGVFYFAGVGASYLLYIENFAQEWVTIGLLAFLFVMGIVGNLMYFLGEKQKLSYLNGQISEENMSMRKYEAWFPLWLIVVGNVLLIFAVTPLLWGLLYNMTGTQLFWVQQSGPAWGFFERSFALQPQLGLWSWFGYVAGNVNQSFLGVATLLGIEFSDKAIMPTGIGKAFVLVFRLGTISLALGAVKRYLDLRATTQRLVIALGRSAWELGEREADSEGKISEIEDWRVMDGRRLMWQIRLRQLLHLYPAQLDRILSMLQGKGMWQIQMKARRKKGKGRERAQDPKAMVNHIRAELAEILEDHRLYAGSPATRYGVMRTLLQILEREESLAADLRRKSVLTLVQLLRPHDRANLQERVHRCVASIAASGMSEDLAEVSDPWDVMVEQRAKLAAVYGLVRMGDTDRLAGTLSALRESGTVLQSDAQRYFEWLSTTLSSASAATLGAIQRLIAQAQHNDEEVVPVLDELSIVLQQLSGKKDAPYRKFAAFALGVCLKEEISDRGVQAKTARVLLLCGARFAVPMAWKLFRSSELAVRELLLEAFIEGGMSAPLIRYLKGMLAEGSKNKQILAAWLLGRLPAGEENRRALCEKAADEESAVSVRWMAFRSLAQLGQSADLPVLKGIGLDRSVPRLWSAWSYACYSCGDAQGLVDLVDVLAFEHDEIPLREAAEEILTHGRGEEGIYVSLVLDREAEKNARVDASEHLVNRRSPLALLALGHVLLGGKKYPKNLRQCAAEDLGVLGRSMHPDEIEALAQVQAPSVWAATPLLHALELDDDRLVRIRAARALGRLGLSEIRDKFEKILIDPDENAQLRQVVAQAVGELGDPEWMSFLLERFPQEKSLQVRQGMVRALDLLGAEPEFFVQCLEEESNAKLLQLVLQSLGQRPLSEGERERLLDFLDAGAKEVRAAAADVLGAQSVEGAIEPLCVRINHEKESDKDVRRASIKALRRLAMTYGRQDEVREEVEHTFMEDPDHLVVQDTATVLARLYGQSAGPMLLEALEKRDERETWKKGFAGIVRALGDIRWPEAGPRLYALLEKELNAERTHLPRLISLIRPVGLASGTDAKDMMMDLIHRNDPAFSWIAAQVVAEIGDPVFIEPVTTYLEDRRADGTLEPNLEGALLFALVRLGVPERLSEFVNLAHDTERPIARRRILNLMPDLQVGLSNVALLQAMDPGQTPHEKIREAAVRTMGLMAGRIDVVVQALRWQANSDPRAKIREAAQDALRNITYQVQEAIYEEAPSRRASSPIMFKGKAIHPVFSDVFSDVGERRPSMRRIHQPIIPTRTTTPTVHAEKPAKVVTKKPAVKRVSHLELLVAALAKNDLRETRRLLEDTTQPVVQQPFWQALSGWLSRFEEFTVEHKGWAFAQGNPSGGASFWPFLIMEKPVSRREYLEFCQETGHSLPEGWKPDSKSLKYPNDAINNISWWDAKSYADHHGWELPTHAQILLAHSRPVFGLDGKSANWTASEEYGEWSVTSNRHRRQLIQAYPPRHSARSAYRREERSSVLTFRCVRSLNCSTDLFEQLVAWQLHQYLPDLVYSCAFQNKLPLNADVAATLQPLLRRATLKLVSAELVEIEGKATVVVEKAPPKPVKPKVTSTDKFWKRISEGNWKKSLSLLRTAPQDLDRKLLSLRDPLEQLCDWYEQHSDMVWIGGDWKGTSRERPFLIQNNLITRKSYSEFCKEKDVALPRNIGRSAKNISEPQAPVTGITLYEAKNYAVSSDAELPSLELLERANERYPLNSFFTEWTSTPYRHNRRLIHCYSAQSYTKMKTFRQDERQAPVGFRVVRPLKQEKLPVLLGELQEKLPSGLPVEQFPTYFSSALKESLTRLSREVSS